MEMPSSKTYVETAFGHSPSPPGMKTNNLYFGRSSNISRSLQQIGQFFATNFCGETIPRPASPLPLPAY